VLLGWFALVATQQFKLSSYGQLPTKRILPRWWIRNFSCFKINFTRRSCWLNYQDLLIIPKLSCKNCVIKSNVIYLNRNDHFFFNYFKFENFFVGLTFSFNLDTIALVFLLFFISLTVIVELLIYAEQKLCFTDIGESTDLIILKLLCGYDLPFHPPQSSISIIKEGFNF
jgi:hypothetical protein